MQSTETDQKTRPDIDALIADLREGAADIDGKHAWPSTMSQAAAALAAERDRADRAEMALTNAPHQRGCLSLYEFKDRLSCDCWKSEATA